MNNQTILLLLLLCFIRNIENIEPISSKVQSERVEKLRCGYNLDTLWTAELAHSPFAAGPLISDVDGNGKDEIIAAPFSESFTVLQGQNGQILHHSSWPAVNLDNSVHASPLQFDIDHDGMLDIMFTLSSGELRFYSPDGVRLKDKTYQIDPVYVSKAWYQYELILNTPAIDKYAFVEKPKGDEFQHVVPVDAHVLSTPVLVDLNNDKRVEELVISVSYFFEEDDFLIERIEKVVHKDTSGSLKFRNIKCEEHEGISCSHYCKPCSKVICSQCITQTKTHNRHHILVDEENFDDKKVKFEKAQRNIIRWSKESDRMKSEKKEINEKFEKVKQDIFDHKKNWQSMIDKYPDELSKDLKKRQKLALTDFDIEHNEIEETLEKLQTACDTLDSKPCTTSEGVIFFLENFDSLSDSLTEEIPNETYKPSREILFPHFVPGDFSLLKFGSLKVD
ncbi:unnamed protein product [Mytilus edulis]|uniref:B box-type domain-containing protein n=1 Tax=Mytilus edulis TaxID=6550 RepID=A0A8S3QEL4_MYTED|nr:unnamed protein product [Mytilus edulis]